MNKKEMVVGTDREIVYYEEEIIKTLTRSLSLNSDTSVKMIRMPTISRQNNINMSISRYQALTPSEQDFNLDEHKLEIETIKGHGKYFNDTLKKSQSFSEHGSKLVRKISKTITPKINTTLTKMADSKRSNTMAVGNRHVHKGLNFVLEGLENYLQEVDPDYQRQGTGTLKIPKSTPNIDLENVEFSTNGDPNPLGSNPLENGRETSNSQKLEIKKHSKKLVYLNQETDMIGRVSTFVSVFEKTIGDHSNIYRPKHKPENVLTVKPHIGSSTIDSINVLKSESIPDYNLSESLASSFAATINDNFSINDGIAAKFTPVPIDESRSPSFVGNIFYESDSDNNVPLDDVKQKQVSSDDTLSVPNLTEIDMEEEMNEISNIMNKIDRIKQQSSIKDRWATGEEEQNMKEQVPPKKMNISSPYDRKKQTQSAIITNEDRWAATKEPETKFQGQNKKKTDAKAKTILPKVKLLKKLSAFLRRKNE